MNYFIENKKYFYKKIRYIILTGILFFTAALYAQSGKETGDSLNYLTHLPADSLEIILSKPNLSDNELYYIYKILSNLYLQTDTAKSLEYADVERFDKALGLLDDSVVEMRRVAHHLMPDSLSRFGLKTALSDFCGNYPVISFSYYGDESRLDPKLEVMIYRSIHELVNNALKYAGASRILVQIMQEPDRIAFTVQDDGCGFDVTKETKGTGLQNIRNRIASFGGDIQIDSKAGEGTEINGELRIRNYELGIKNYKL